MSQSSENQISVNFDDVISTLKAQIGEDAYQRAILVARVEQAEQAATVLHRENVRLSARVAELEPDDEEPTPSPDDEG